MIGYWEGLMLLPKVRNGKWANRTQTRAAPAPGQYFQARTTGCLPDTYPQAILTLKKLSN